MSYPKFFSSKDVLSSCGKIRDLQLSALWDQPQLQAIPFQGQPSFSDWARCVYWFFWPYMGHSDGQQSLRSSGHGQESVRPAFLFDFLVCPILSSLNPIPRPLFLSQVLIATKYSAPQTLSAFASNWQCSYYIWNLYLEL